MEGYDDWKHIVDAIERHETSKIHLDSCLINSGGYKENLWRQCRGQGYDGANTMEGTGGVQKLIKDIEPNAVCVHCAAHNLNLVLNDAVRELLKVPEHDNKSAQQQETLSDSEDNLEVEEHQITDSDNEEEYTIMPDIMESSNSDVLLSQL
ncbi:hypothetical protein EVAR_22001_1 [Eumeta japonica]|uniref:Zinc finger MYM-type protein 1 n=1 Tax=Eumeta variegata TaxID=151549 RepID=A0A4C1YVA1_EUMVA|nr:hypothetical protein EVAR_22001_1 [Eumeta japonica]